jgi:hypothetical protein
VRVEFVAHLLRDRFRRARLETKQSAEHVSRLSVCPTA